MLGALLSLSSAWANDLLGTWVYTNPMWGETITLELRPDGSGALDGEPLRYQHTGGQLVVEQYGERLVYAVKVSGAQLTASGGDLEGTLVFTRSGSAPGAPVAPAPVAAPPDPAPAAPVPAGRPASAGGSEAFVGTWTDGQGVIAFHADGTCDYVGQRLTWAWDGSVILLTGPGGTVRLPMRAQGDTLTLTEGGQTQTLRRQGSASPVADSSGVAGVYVASEGSVDAQYAMSITQYLTLWPDGTVGWSKSELGASRTQVTDSLQRFSSFRTNPAGKGQTWGTWQATPGGVFVQWQIWNGLQSQGRIDPSTGALTLTGMGILNEGANVTYERQR